MPSFDIVSKVEQHELDNAWQQAAQEVSQRYDFRGTQTEIERSEGGLLLRSDSEGRLEAALGVLREKCAKRGVPLKSLDPQKPEPASKGTLRQLIKIKEGLSQDKSKEIVKFIKANKFKVQPAIQGDQLRVTGKKRDDLQTLIASLKAEDFDQDLQFVNFRD